MIDFILRVVWETWGILKEASVFLLFGFLLAGILATLVPAKALSRLFGTGRIKSVLWASAIGAPLPLCSCGVLPAALALKKQGATPGATVAFLIATPETGVDSISLSYALMDPVITVARPLAGVITAIGAGLATNFLGANKSQDGESSIQRPLHAHDADDSAVVHAHGHPHLIELPAADPPVGDRLSALRSRVRRAVHYAFHQLLDDTSYWLVLGIVLSGIVAAALPSSFFEQYMGSEFLTMLIMLLFSIPIYTCASASTPLAAALVMKGLNPGAALVFLLAGPATNLGSIVVLLKFLGLRIIAIYLAAIVVVTLAAGYALNWVYRTWDLNPQVSFGAATAVIPESIKIGGALVMVALLLLSMRRAHVPAEWLWLRDRLAGLSGLHITAARLIFATSLALGVLYIGSGLFAIQPGESALRMRFGKIVAPALEPGLHYRLPWPFESHRIVPKDQVQRIEFGFAKKTEQLLAGRAAGRERLTAGGNLMPEAINTTGTWFQQEAEPEEPFLLTGDGNLIDLRWAVQYRVNDAVAFAFNVAEPEKFVRGVSLAALRAVAARREIDAIYTADRNNVERQVEAAIQRVLDKVACGIQVVSFQLLYVHPPEEVHDAFRDVASAQEDRLRTVNRANIFAVETVNQAKAEAASMIEQALAFKEQQILHAQGDATNFTLKLEAFRRAPDLTKFRLQIEAIEETLPGLQKFIRPGAGQVKELDLWMLQPPGRGR